MFLSTLFTLCANLLIQPQNVSGDPMSQHADDQHHHQHHHAQAQDAYEVLGEEPLAEEYLNVVATTKFYAKLIKETLGKHARVFYLIDGSIDPHHFEPSGKQIIRIAEADLVLLNGGGYDDWATRTADVISVHDLVHDMLQVLSIGGVTDGSTVSIVQAVSGSEISIDKAKISRTKAMLLKNNHYWNNPDVVLLLNQCISKKAFAMLLQKTHISDQDKQAEDMISYFTTNYQRLNQKKMDILNLAQRIYDKHHSKTVMAVCNEPVLGHLLNYMGFIDEIVAPNSALRVGLRLYGNWFNAGAHVDDISGVEFLKLHRLIDKHAAHIILFYNQDCEGSGHKNILLGTKIAPRKIIVSEQMPDRFLSTSCLDWTETMLLEIE